MLTRRCWSTGIRILKDLKAIIMVSKILVRFRVNLKFRNEVVRHCCLNQIANIWVSKNPKPGQMLLLCSDGVWEFITPMEVATSWRTTNPTRFSWDGDAWLGRNLLWESGWIWESSRSSSFFLKSSHLDSFVSENLSTLNPLARHNAASSGSETM